MKGTLKTIIAFSLLGGTVTAGLVLSALDKSLDVYPGEDTKIRLYGEAHGSSSYYGIELSLWEERYCAGCRSLFLELPYYTAEFLNLWMQEDSDGIIDRIFTDIRGTQSGNGHYYEFFHKIKERCPETVFYGTDVGHQNDSTGARYLDYLSANGMRDSERWQLAQECIRQGKEFYASDQSQSGMSPVRESYMVSNFIGARSRCGDDDIMGIYGSYHTSLDNPDLMAGRLRAHYGDVISSVRLSSLAYGADKPGPYRPGFCVTGLVFLLMLLVPNIYWGTKAKPEGYEEAAKNENKILLLLERAGESLVSCSMLVFPALNPYLRILPEGLFFDWRILLCAAALVLMMLYECYWLRYFRSERTLKDQYRSFAGFPLAGATLPVIAAFLLGLYAMNLIVTCSAVILGIGHIGIHLMHSREAER